MIKRAHLLLSFMLMNQFGCSTGEYRPENKPDSQKRLEATEVSKWRETARFQIEQRGEEVRICGDKHPEAYKSYAKNLVRIEFTVVGEGTVEKIRSLENTTGSKGIQECLLEAFKNTKFSPIPKHVSSLIINFPFVFKTGAQTIQ